MDFIDEAEHFIEEAMLLHVFMMSGILLPPFQIEQMVLLSDTVRT